MIYKFRTMRTDQGHSTQTWACDDDPRMTRVGRVLRPFRLDELPQLFNVLKGEMNIVGPRPEQPEIFAELRRELGYYPQAPEGASRHHGAGPGDVAVRLHGG